MRFVSAPDPCAVGVRSARSWRGAGQSQLRLSRSSCPATAHPGRASVRGGRGTTHRCPSESRQRGHEADRRSLLRRRDAGRAAANAVANTNQPRRRVRRTNGAGPAGRAGRMRTGRGLGEDWASDGMGQVQAGADRFREAQRGAALLFAPGFAEDEQVNGQLGLTPAQGPVHQGEAPRGERLVLCAPAAPRCSPCVPRPSPPIWPMPTSSSNCCESLQPGSIGTEPSICAASAPAHELGRFVQPTVHTHMSASEGARRRSHRPRDASTGHPGPKGAPASASSFQSQKRRSPPSFHLAGF
jgi:hypothetical protein